MSLELLKVEFCVVVLQRDDDGTPIAEVPLGEGVVFPGRLDDLPNEIRELVKRETEKDED